MAEPFDAALRVLKATLDQQMYAQMPAHPDLAQVAMDDDSLPLGGPVQQFLVNQPVGDETGFLQEYGQQSQMNRSGDRSLGTMHPAIVGMLRRRGGTANVDPRQNQGNPVRITRTPQFAQDAYDLRQEGLGPADVQGQMHPTLGMQQGNLSIPFGGASGADRQMLMAQGHHGIVPVPPEVFEFQPPPMVAPGQLRSADATMPIEQALESVLTGEPMADAWSTLMKGKKKSKPFHGYNPKKHSKKGGLNAKGRAAAKRKTGANLKPPVTTKPSKLKPGGKKAKRRKSFCARMAGVKGPTSKKGKLTPKGAALKRWNC